MQLAQENSKNEMKERIISLASDDDLLKIDLNNNIRWEESGKEFSLNGEMFDVVRSKTVNGKTILYCLNDTKEQEIINQYNNQTKNNSSAGKKGTVLPVLTLYLEQQYEISLSSPVASNILYSDYVVRFPRVIADEIATPPRA